MLEKMAEYGHEQIFFASDNDTGLRAIIAVHSTVLGPALGGTRMWDYESEEDAIYDVLRLSKGMTLKNSAAGLNLGGGKAVIIGNPRKLKNEKFLRAYGKFVDRLNGSYITAEDINIDVSDVEIISKSTKHVVGLHGEGKSGDPSPFTARGIFKGMQAGAKAKFGQESLKDKAVAIQGVGKVGYSLCKWLKEEGSNLIIADINKKVADKVAMEFDARVVTSEEILSVECDIFAPCALGAVLNKDNVASLKCKLVAGGANNILVDDLAGEALANRDILYIPDYIINAGGVINISVELEGQYSEQKAIDQVDKIYNNVENLLKFAKKERLATHLASDKFAMNRIQDFKKVKN